MRRGRRARAGARVALARELACVSRPTCRSSAALRSRRRPSCRAISFGCDTFWCVPSPGRRRRRDASPSRRLRVPSRRSRAGARRVRFGPVGSGVRSRQIRRCDGISCLQCTRLRWARVLNKLGGGGGRGGARGRERGWGRGADAERDEASRGWARGRGVGEGGRNGRVGRRDVSARGGAPWIGGAPRGRSVVGAFASRRSGRGVGARRSVTERSVTGRSVMGQSEAERSGAVVRTTARAGAPPALRFRARALRGLGSRRRRRRLGPSPAASDAREGTSVRCR